MSDHIMTLNEARDRIAAVAPKDVDVFVKACSVRYSTGTEKTEFTIHLMKDFKVEHCFDGLALGPLADAAWAAARSMSFEPTTQDAPAVVVEEAKSE